MKLKYILLGLFAVVTVGQLSAQVEIFVEGDESTLLNGTEYVQNGSPETDQVKAYLRIRNTSGVTEDFSVRRERLILGTPLDLLCFGELCLDGSMSDVYTYPASFYLTNGMDDKFQPGYAPQGQSFCAINKYIILDSQGRLVDSVTVKFVIGVNECFLSTNEPIIENKEMSMYPNPSKGMVTFKDMEVGSSLEVLDLLGKRMLKTEVFNSTQQLDLTQLPEGMYLVSVRRKDGTALPARKLVIRK
jgi:hypothetical protein